MRESFFSVSISYADYAPRVVAASPRLSFAVVVGTVGGTIGMFSGLSFLTVGEFIEYFAVAAVLGLLALARCRARPRAVADDVPSKLLLEDRNHAGRKAGADCGAAVGAPGAADSAPNEKLSMEVHVRAV